MPWTDLSFLQAVSISHFSVISNVIQMATHFRITDPLCKDKMMVPGDVGVAGKNLVEISPFHAS